MSAPCDLGIRPKPWSVLKVKLNTFESRGYIFKRAQNRPQVFGVRAREAQVTVVDGVFGTHSIGKEINRPFGALGPIPA